MPRLSSPRGPYTKLVQGKSARSRARHKQALRQAVSTFAGHGEWQVTEKTANRVVLTRRHGREELLRQEFVPVLSEWESGESPKSHNMNGQLRGSP